MAQEKELWKNEEVVKAVKALYNGQKDTADKYFRPKRNDHARYALHFAENLVVFMMMSDSKKDQAESFEALTAAQKIAKDYKKAMSKLKGTKDPAELNEILDSKIVLGEVYLLLAFHGVIDGSDKVKGMMNLNSAWSIVSNLWKEINAAQAKGVVYDQDLLDVIKFDYSLFSYFLSLIPDFAGPAAATVAKLLGFSGDREQGEKMLLEVAKGKGIRSPFARGMLCMKFLFLPDRDFPCQEGVLSDVKRAQELAEEGLLEYPTSGGFLFMVATALRKKGNAEESAIHLQKLDATLTGQGIDSNVVKLNIGHCFFNNLEFEKAISYYDPLVLKDDRKDPFLALLFRGAANIMIGKAKEGLEDIQNAHASAEKEKKSDLAKEISRYLAEGMHKLIFYELMVMRKELPPVEKCEALLRHIDRVSEQLDSAAAKAKGSSSMNKLFSKKGSAPHHVTIFASKGTMLRRIGKNTEALAALNDAIQCKPTSSAVIENEIYWMAYFDAAEIEYANGNKDSARSLLQKVSKDGHSVTIRLSAKKALQQFE